MREFNITFKDTNYGDWRLVLHTSENKTAEEIDDIITTYAEIVSNGILGDDYSPVTILDRLCNDMQGDGRDWYWTVPGEDVVIDIW